MKTHLRLAVLFTRSDSNPTTIDRLYGVWRFILQQLFIYLASTTPFTVVLGKLQQSERE